MINPFHAVFVALVNAVNSNKASPAIGARCLAHTDGIAHRMGLGKTDSQVLVRRAFAQVVQVRRRQLGQANVAHIAVVRVGPFQEVDDGRAADVLVSFVHLHQKLNIQGCVLACEGRCRGLVVLDERDLGQAVGVPLFDQSGDLGAAVAAGVLQVTQQHATVMPAAPGVVKALEHPADVGVSLHVVAVGRKRNVCTGGKKLLDLFYRAQLGLIHVDHHFWMINLLSDSPQITASGSFPILFS